MTRNLNVMTQSHSRRNTCRLCYSNRVELAVPIKPSPVADAYVARNNLTVSQDLFPLDLYLCRDCGHVQLLDVVDPELLFGNYIYSTSVSLGLIEHFRLYVDEVTARFPAAPGSLSVDIGSNDGTALRFFKDKGLRVLGIDPAAEITKRATASGVETLPAFFTSELASQIRKDHGPASYVTANNVFAHSDSLADMADGIRKMLTDEGVFVFEVSYLADIVDKLLFDTVYHEHLCYHSIKPFHSFFRRHGLELFDIQRLPTKGGSIRGYVQRQAGPHKVAPIIDRLLALEAGLGLDQPETYRKYTARIERIKENLLGLLRKLKAEGNSIAGFGASATVTTLIYNFELSPFLSFLVDDNVSRHGLFSPGCHIPVLSPQAVFDRKTDYVVVLAWQYAEPILKKHGAFLEKGGHFILPMPDVKVI